MVKPCCHQLFPCTDAIRGHSNTQYHSAILNGMMYVLEKSKEKNNPTHLLRSMKGNLILRQVESPDKSIIGEHNMTLKLLFCNKFLPWKHLDFNRVEKWMYSVCQRDTNFGTCDVEEIRIYIIIKCNSEGKYV